MVHRYQSSRLNRGKVQSLNLFMFIFLLIFSGFSLLLAAGNPIPKLVQSYKTSNPVFQREITKAKAQQQFLDFARQKYEAVRLNNIFQDKIKKLPAVDKMRVYTRFFDKMRVDGQLTPQLMSALRSRRSDLNLLEAATGSISGTVLLEGFTTFETIMVNIFDEYGFYAGSVTASALDGSYQVGGLATGNYYVLTYSSFVDEFYNNVPSYFMTNWRSATLVSVTNGSDTPGIDFDLQRGATLSGTIYEQDGTTPIASVSANFRITSSTSPMVMFERLGFTNLSGDYSINVPAIGEFKISAETYGYQTQYYNNKSSWAAADPVTILSLTDNIGNINFSLAPGATGPPMAGGQIEGTVLNSATQPVGGAFIFAFDPADTSIAGIGISTPTSPPGVTTTTTVSLPGEYEISDLPAGSYILYANDLFGSSAGEYYLDATTPDAAAPVAVVVGDTTRNIDFTLPDGGAISGTVTDANAAPVDSSLIIAIKVDTQSAGQWLGERLDFGFSLTDVSGAYQVNGLSSGSYILRTVTLFGPEAGKVVDEYYQGVQDIFAFDQATRVTVTAPQTTANIDFVLDLSSAITGFVFESDGVTPVQGYPLILALDTVSGHPTLALPLYNSTDGSYLLGPLAGGTYILFAIVLPPDSTNIRYVPQFYDGASTPDTATPVVVASASIKFGVNFNILRASNIRGFVNLSPGFPAGADSLQDIIVAVYDSDTGVMKGNSDISFAGAYNVSGLPPGNYKVEAFPTYPGYSATYGGGGTTFDAGQVYPLAEDDSARVDIILQAGNGTISGTLTDATGTTEVPGVMVIAYDPTGHAVSAAVSGGNLSQEPPFTNGQYTIPGLVDGTYYVRTFSLFQILLLLENQDLGGGPLGVFADVSNPDLLATITQDSPFDLLKDEWYDNRPISANFNLGDFLLQVIFSGDIEVPLVPFNDSIPANADPITLSSGNNQISNIDFQLAPRGDVVTGLPDDGKNHSIPTSFELTQNYPNPFNPSTTIQYKVPETTQLTITIFNILGQKIRTLVDGVVSAGSYQVKWDGRNELGNEVSSGIYLLRLHSENFTRTRRMVLMR